jgi:hypothetical protein
MKSESIDAYVMLHHANCNYPGECSPHSVKDRTGRKPRSFVAAIAFYLALAHFVLHVLAAAIVALDQPLPFHHYVDLFDALHLCGKFPPMPGAAICML